MRLIESSGFEPVLNLTQDQRKSMVLTAMAFLRSGGVLSFSDWEGMSVDERVAFEMAGDLIDVERAIRIGLACSGEDGRARVRADADGGQSMDQRAVNATTERLAGRMADIQVENA